MTTPIGTTYTSIIPQLADDASITEAFQYYHNGLDPITGSYDPNNSIEAHFKKAYDRIGTAETDINNLESAVTAIQGTISGLGTTYIRRVAVSTSGSENIISPQTASIVPLTVSGVSSQSANLQEWKDTVSGSVIAKVDPTGKIFSFDGTGVSQAVTLAGTQTMTNKTLTSPVIDTATINDASSNYSLLKAPKERMNMVATAAGGATSLYVETSSVWSYINADASSDISLTVKYNASTNLSTKMSSGDAITVVVLMRNGASAKKISSLTVDSTVVSVKWMYGTAPIGNASSTDIYTFNIIKTDSGWAAIGSCIKFGL